MIIIKTVMPKAGHAAVQIKDLPMACTASESLRYDEPHKKDERI